MNSNLQTILPAIGMHMAERPMTYPVELIAESIHNFFIRITQRTPDGAFEVQTYPEGLTHLAAFPITLKLSDADGTVSEMMLNMPQGGTQ